MNEARPLLSVVAIARNEIRDVAGFIDNVTQYADEIIVVDDGSSDGTVEFLRNCGARVQVLQHRLTAPGGFAAQRNAGAELATGVWLLHMDIDERISPALSQEILDTISNSELNGYRYRRLNFFLHRPFRAGGWQTWNNAQLGRRGRHRFVNPIHEMVEVDGGAAMVGQLCNEMWHLNDESFVERIGKNASYAQMTADRISKSHRVRWWHILFVPLYRGLKSYFFRGAWRHGELGLIFGLYAFSSAVNGFAVAWDDQNRLSREELERKLKEVDVVT